MATYASSLLWDIDNHHDIATRQVQLVRDAGAVAQLPLHLWQLAHVALWTGDLAGAESLAVESDGAASSTNSPMPPYTLLRMAALQGAEAEFDALLANASESAALRGQEISTSSHWATAVLCNGLERYEAAAHAAQQAASERASARPAMWVLPELVEAAARIEDIELAREALDRLLLTTQPCDTDFAGGVEARCRALVSEGSEADELYREALERLSRTCLRPDWARTHLLYGEWLHREGRQLDAREHLRRAYDMFVTVGAQAFADRARRELIATGEKVPKRTAGRAKLSPQEEQIARLARDGFSNREIGGQLFISSRTVEWHLRKVFAKLDVGSRRELRTALPADDHVRAGT
jgi:ATP/maltotriose-dependent transcriptional regulator MalT